ncbi:MAG: type II toxin-antitoxin system RelE/ParE family toxin [Myxococcales bacterium]|nr:type II toxin-antitoxin system RelE/ParE family toxin [Myxococcales bacterium]
MRIVLSKRAQAQLDRIDAWWHTHRDKAPERFEEELEQAKRFLQATPALATIYLVRGGRTIRWVLLPKTKVKLYFWVDEKADVVHVLSAWGGKRGRQPKLAR